MFHQQLIYYTGNKLIVRTAYIRTKNKNQLCTILCYVQVVFQSSVPPSHFPTPSFSYISYMNISQEKLDISFSLMSNHIDQIDVSVTDCVHWNRRDPMEICNHPTEQVTVNLTWTVIWCDNVAVLVWATLPSYLWEIRNWASTENSTPNQDKQWMPLCNWHL